MELRPYQVEGINRVLAAWKEYRSVCLQLPTGGGKSVCFAAIASEFIRKNEPVLLVVHREELLTQAAAHLQRATNKECGLIKAGYKPNPQAQIQVASIQSLVRRKLPTAGLVVVDECHHSAASTYRKVLDAYPFAKILGVSATPNRIDGYGLREIFEHLIQASAFKASVGDLIADGYLAPFRLFGGFIDLHMGNSLSKGDYSAAQLGKAVHAIDPKTVVSAWLKTAPEKKTCLFAINIPHSLAIVNEFLAQGIRAYHLDGESPLEERRDALARFERGDITVLSNVGLFTEGFDLPAIECVVTARPTKSVTLWLQMVGRALRPNEGKEYAIILDCTDNWQRLGKPDQERNWTLDPVSAEPGLGTWNCQECKHVFVPMPAQVTITRVWDALELVQKLASSASCPACGKVVTYTQVDSKKNETEEDPELPLQQVDGDKIYFKEIPTGARSHIVNLFIDAEKHIRTNSLLKNQKYSRLGTLKENVLNRKDLTLDDVQAGIIIMDLQHQESAETAIVSIMMPEIIKHVHANDWQAILKLMENRTKEIRSLVWKSLPPQVCSRIHKLKEASEQRAKTKVESIKVDSLVKFVDKRTWKSFRVVAINAASKKVWLEAMPTPVSFDEIDLVLL